jgi:2-polyprenyl-6-methoxyphenol hydroxylase-like FAD-dependent oxidoreductase
MSGIRQANTHVGSGICATNRAHTDNGFPYYPCVVLAFLHFRLTVPSPQESMMTSVRTVLVVGGGTAGCTVAALLARAGVAVEIVERKPDFTVHGSGITLQGAAHRVLREVGVYDELHRHGFEFAALGLRSVDGRLLVENPTPPTLGAYRPKMAELLAAAAVEAGAKVRLGATITSFTQDEHGVDVVFADGDTARYDLLIGADGVRSSVRRQLGIEAEPRPVGMGIWRVHARRPAEVTNAELVYDGPLLHRGLHPHRSRYPLRLPRRGRPGPVRPHAERKVATMRELATPYRGPWEEIREDITDADRINYTWFEHLLIDGAWNRGRAVVIGDAAHTCPPTLALGAAMALEDASVLAELLLTRDHVDQELFDAFVARRMPRAGAVVNGSMQLATWLLEGEPQRRHPRPDGSDLRPARRARLMAESYEDWSFTLRNELDRGLPATKHAGRTSSDAVDRSSSSAPPPDSPHASHPRPHPARSHRHPGRHRTRGACSSRPTNRPT